jgi:hypothetical protein
LAAGGAAQRNAARVYNKRENIMLICRIFVRVARAATERAVFGGYFFAFDKI